MSKEEEGRINSRVNTQEEGGERIYAGAQKTRKPVGKKKKKE